MIDYLLLAASFILFIAGLCLARRTGPTPVKVILVLVLAAIFFLLHDLYTVSYIFTGKWIDESVLFHLAYGVGGAGFSEYWQLIASSIIFVIIGISGSHFIASSRNSGSDPQTLKWNNPASYALILAGIGFIPGNIQLADILNASTQSDFHAYYRPPSITGKPENKRNLILIYAEGIERTYFDQTIFPGLMKELRKLESRSTYFTDLRQTWGTGWTIGGMTATQCGIPLVTPSHGNSMHGMDSFLGSAVCLGDLLAGDGYSLSYLGGAKLNFAGKGKFYASHGFEDVRGRNTMTRLLEDRSYMSPWGLYDDSLFDIAHEKFLNLSRKNQPFGLFMLTLDTHPPDGTPSGSCSKIKYGNGKNPVLNAVACTDFLIGRFVEKVLNSDFADNTTIVIASDHLSMKNTAYSLLKDADRTIMFMIIEPGSGQAAEITSKGSLLDVGVIILHALGYEGTLGLGRNLLDGDVSLSASLENINTALKSWKDSIIEFWNFPKLDDGIVIDVMYREMLIKGRKFQVPALITFNEQMETQIRFQFDSSPEHKRLIDYILELDMDSPFIWLDNCKTIKMVPDKYGLCAVLGKPGSRNLTGFRINGVKKFHAEDFRNAAKLETSDELLAYNRQRIEH